MELVLHVYEVLRAVPAIFLLKVGEGSWFLQKQHRMEWTVQEVSEKIKEKYNEDIAKTFEGENSELCCCSLIKRPNRTGSFKRPNNGLISVKAV